MDDLRCSFNQGGGFAQKNPGKNPIKPETLDAGAAIQTILLEFVFNHAAGLGQFGTGFIGLTKMLAGHAKNDPGGCGPWCIVLRIVQTPPAPGCSPGVIPPPIFHQGQRN